MSRLEEVHRAAVKAEQERLDREAIEHLDWDHDPVCQTYRLAPTTGQHVHCERAATWRMFCRGCGFLVLVCDPCRSQFLISLRPKVCLVCRQAALVMVGWAFEPLVMP